MRSFRRRRTLGGLLLGAVIVATAAGIVAVARTDGADRACSETDEALDARSLQHILPGAPEPTFVNAAPTSGPHAATGLEGGVHDGPSLPPTAQIGLLERGFVLVQTTGSTAPLAGLAGPQVVVAANPAIGNPVVATAWRVRLVCDETDLPRLRRFVADRAGKGPDGH